MLKTLCSLICVLAVFVSVKTSIFAQSAAVKNSENTTDIEELDEFQVKDQYLHDVLAQIALRYGIAISLEFATTLEQQVEDRYIFKIPFSIATNRKTGKAISDELAIGELFDKIVERHNLYSWKIENGIINVFPKKTHRDAVLQKVLATKISRLSIAEKTSCYNAVKSLTETPEIKKNLADHKLQFVSQGINGFYIQNLGKEFKLEVVDANVKDILNKIITESPTAKFWLINRYGDEKQFLTVRISASFENPTENRKAVSNKH